MSANFSTFIHCTNDILNENWFTYGLDLSMVNLINFLLALKIIIPPMNPANHKNFSSLSKSIAAASRDFDLGQDG